MRSAKLEARPCGNTGEAAHCRPQIYSLGSTGRDPEDGKEIFYVSYSWWEPLIVGCSLSWKFDVYIEDKFVKNHSDDQPLDFNLTDAGLRTADQIADPVMLDPIYAISLISNAIMEYETMNMRIVKKPLIDNFTDHEAMIVVLHKFKIHLL